MKVTIDDLWLKNDDDGNPPSRAAKRSLANSRDPMKANVLRGGVKPLWSRDALALSLDHRQGR